MSLNDTVKARPAKSSPVVATSRGGATRKALLDATIRVMAATGYAATTTQAVLDASGISRGSLLHQFRTRDALMVAAALEAVEQMFDAVRDRLAGFADPMEALHQYPTVLWEVQNEPAAQAFAEIQLAARWEQSLRGALLPAVKEINARISRDIHAIAEANGLRNVNNLVVQVGALISAMQGLAVSSALMDDPAITRDILKALGDHYTDCLDASISDWGGIG